MVWWVNVVPHQIAMEHLDKDQVGKDQVDKDQVGLPDQPGTVLYSRMIRMTININPNYNILFFLMILI